jgi:hypothetical protein
MSNVQPQGDALKNAIQWVSEQRKKNAGYPGGQTGQ